MANETPSSDTFTGLSRAVLQYSEGFKRITERLRQPDFSEADWGPLESLVDTENWERQGVFLTSQSETFGWQTYKEYIAKFSGATHWEGALRRITETKNLVFLELEERNTRNGETDIANTVTIYEFNDAGKLKHLDVYVSHVGKRPAS